MSILDDAAQELADLLTEATGWTVYPSIPGRLSPPLGVIYPGDPYITEGETFKHITAHFDVRLIAPNGTNESIAADVNRVLADTVVALRNADYDLSDIRTGTVSLNGGQFVAADFTASTQIKL